MTFILSSVKSNTKSCLKFQEHDNAPRWLAPEHTFTWSCWFQTNLLTLPVAPLVLSAWAEQEGRCEVEDILGERRCLPAPTANGVGRLHIPIFLKREGDDAERRVRQEGE